MSPAAPVTLDEEEQTVYGLPPLKTDGAGVPVVDDSDGEQPAEPQTDE